MTPPTREGTVAFDAPGSNKPINTWYKIVGDLASYPGPALVALHGGPGAGHEYLSPHTDLYHRHGIPIIYYDQVGCGRSTHFKEKLGDASFWTPDLFIRELDNLVDHLRLRDNGFFLLGHSWGGILGGIYASLRPKGLKKIILSSAPSSVPLLARGLRELLAALPDETRATLEECDRKGDHESPEFEAAAKVFNDRHLCRLDPYPDDVSSGLNNLKEDPTSYLTMKGPSEFTLVGAFKDWEGWEEGANIEVETLLLNGQYDEVTDLCVRPWFSSIPKVKWVTIENASHMTHWEQRERYMQLVAGFLFPSS
ncbi:Alpha/Beta hydrolase protein [Ustulina deusta]|nr:Alpha/Beta hydrolase protein [Ustulina deusta]